MYQWFGSPASTGPGAGRFATALDAWNYAADKRHGDLYPPAGVPVYFGVSPNRTDANKRAGDVGMSIGGGLGIFTDSSGARVGVMTLAARAVQTQRPYLGWCGDFVGHPVTAATTITPAATTAVEFRAVTAQRKDEPMFHLKGSSKRGEALVGPGHYHSLTPEESKQITLLASGVIDATANDRLYDLIKAMCSKP
ncbi:hypothetical protein [Frigoribacterium sp. RIT-PI-h]|uniref:hypothetical protein n=1 Tax=Frigoribacterium sp. RIT-PI-h TaxID=1690245 RepID=UPI00128EDB35|nr:hypothetical protein [Frigoribacterium sp. RIT-PI-h]